MLLGDGDIAYYVPFAVAVLLLSLGSDYNLLLVDRIWQEAEKRPTREAIRVAAPRSSAAITIAGVAFAGSFHAARPRSTSAFREPRCCSWPGRRRVATSEHG